MIARLRISLRRLVVRSFISRDSAVDIGSLGGLVYWNPGLLVAKACRQTLPAADCRLIEETSRQVETRAKDIQMHATRPPSFYRLPLPLGQRQIMSQNAGLLLH